MRRALLVAALALGAWLAVFAGLGQAEDLKAAQRLLKAQRFEQALPLLQQVVRQHPNNIKALFLLGVTYQELKRFNEARRVFERTLAIDPEFAPGHRRLIRVCLRLDDLPCAEQHVRYLKSAGHVFRPEEAERLRLSGIKGEIPIGPPRLDAQGQPLRPDDRLAQRPPPRPGERPLAGYPQAPQAATRPPQEQRQAEDKTIAGQAQRPASEAPPPAAKGQTQPVQIAQAKVQPAQIAQPVPAAPSPLTVVSGRRVALVIGNGNYPAAPLKNPVNDATDIAAALKGLGFEVELIKNAGRADMVRAINSFGGKLNAADVGLFYFAGHGMQIKGNNYLVPVDARPESETDVEFESVDAGRLLGKMETAKSKLNIVVLDACRNNPFARSFRSAEMGLARMDAPAGSLIAYATAPGSVAADGAGRNGVYTKNLLSNMKLPNIPIEEVFKRVRVGVMTETAKKQVPWESSSLTGNFSFCCGR